MAQVAKDSLNDKEVNKITGNKKSIESNAHRKGRLDHSPATMTDESKRIAANSISGGVARTLELQNTLNLAADKVEDVINIDGIMVFLLVEETDELVLELSRGSAGRNETWGSRIEIGKVSDDLYRDSENILTLESAVVDAVLNEKTVITNGAKPQIILPLKANGKAIGVLCVTKRPNDTFDTHEKELLTSIGQQVSASLENARLYQDMKHTLTQLKQSEERFRHLFENASDAIWVHDLEGKTLAANKACSKVTGHNTDELTGISVCHLLSEDSRCVMEEIENRLLEAKPVVPSCEVELHKKDGTSSILEVTTSSILHEGEVVGFQHSARDTTDEKQMQENLRYYLQQVTRAQEEERKRVARELHDETLQNLIVISRQLEKISSSEALWEQSIEVVRGLKKQIEAAIQEMRRFSHDLRPSVLDDLGLLPALELLADDLEKENITTYFKITGIARRLQPEVEVMVFRIAQEAVRNIRRHAEAATAEMMIEFSADKLKVTIRDDGKGFNLPHRPGDLASWGKLGLVGMHERASLLGGNIALKSTPGAGTEAVIEVRI